MSTVSLNVIGATASVSVLDGLDQQAEREAAALEFFAQELDQPPTIDPVRALAEESACAEARGFPTPSLYRYDRTAAVDAWLKCLDSLKSGKPAAAPRTRIPDTRAERERRRGRRVQREAIAIALAKVASVMPPVSKREALVLAQGHLSARVIERRLQDGSLPAVRLGRSAAAKTGSGLLIEVRDIARILSRKGALVP